MSDENGVFISLKDVYDQLVQLNKEITVLISKSDSSKAIDEDHEQRIRGLERWKYAIPVTALTTLVMAVIKIMELAGKK